MLKERTQKKNNLNQRKHLKNPPNGNFEEFADAEPTRREKSSRKRKKTSRYA